MFGRKKLKQLSLLFDAHSREIEDLQYRVHALEVYLGVEYVDGEYVKAKKKLAKKATTKTATTKKAATRTRKTDTEGGNFIKTRVKK